MTDTNDPSNPYGPHAGDQSSNPSANQPSPDPYADPVGQPASQPSAGQPGGYQSYGAQPTGDPLGQQAAASHGQSHGIGDPYGQQQAAGNPYAQQPQADPYAQQNPYAQGYTGAPQGGGFSSNAAAQGKGFFAALFDFSFSSFVTPKIIKIVYVVVTALIGLGFVAFLLTSLISGEPLMIILALIIGPIVSLFYLAIMRMSLEMYFAVIRLSEDVHERLPGR